MKVIIPYFSIIIPCYNVCNYISQCLESIISQSFSNWEAIVVNDGSTDGTARIVREYASKDKRIIFIDKANEGVSRARNTGLNLATGEWVGFLDADDWLAKDALNELYTISYISKSEIIGFNHYYNLNDREWPQEDLYPSYLERSGEDKINFVLDSLFPHYDKYKNNVTVGSIRTVWDKIFKRSLLISNNIIFNEAIPIGEDSFFCFDAFSKANQIQYHNIFLVHYRLLNNSATRNFSPAIDDINKIILNKWKEKIVSLNLWNRDFENCYIGVACECFYRSLRLNILHSQNQSSVIDKHRMIKKLVSFYKSKNIFNIDKYPFLPIGKRILAILILYRQHLLICIYCTITIKISNSYSLRKNT